MALATVANVAPLTGLNRAFVAKGLALMRAREASRSRESCATSPGSRDRQRPIILVF